MTTWYFVSEQGKAGKILSSHRKVAKAFIAAKERAKRTGKIFTVRKSQLIARFTKGGRRIPV